MKALRFCEDKDDKGAGEQREYSNGKKKVYFSSPGCCHPGRRAADCRLSRAPMMSLRASDTVLRS